MDTASPIFYTAVALFSAAYIWILSYHSSIGVSAMVARIRQLDCAGSPLEADTLRYQLLKLVGPDSLTNTNIVGLKQFSLVCLTISVIAAILLTRVYYAVGNKMWFGCAAFAAISFALLITTFATLGANFKSNAMFGPVLQKYAANRAAVVGLLDQLNRGTHLLNQAALNYADQAAAASSVSFAEDEPNSVLSSAAATGTPAPKFNVYIYQLQLRLLQRIKNVRGIVSAKAAATYLNGASGEELFSYLQLNSDGDYSLFTSFLPVFTAADTEMTTSYNVSMLSSKDTNSDILQIVPDDDPDTKESVSSAKLKYTASGILELRRALDDLINMDAAPYANELSAHQAPLTKMLYIAPIVLLFFVFKWYIYRSSRLVVTLAATIVVLAYITYYSYFG